VKDEVFGQHTIDKVPSRASQASCRYQIFKMQYHNSTTILYMA